MAFRPRKRFGQNFLHDPAIARKILDAADLVPGRTVVELGAGRGFLTRPLAEAGGRVIALELDRDLFAELEAHFALARPRAGEAGVELLNVDFTTISITGLLATRGLDRCALLGNIPYHLTRDVLFSFLVDEVEVIESACLMVQKEVGDRIVSPPGSRTYGIPSVILQSLYEVRPLFKVGAGSFTPRPNVDSLVLGFRALETPAVAPDELNDFTRLVKNLFQQRRKTIHNTIRAFYGLSSAELRRLHETTSIDLDRRPEDLSKEEFLDISRTLAGMTAVG